nr:MAG TPA: hypothetical protein [Caudoviricetes sp.]
MKPTFIGFGPLTAKAFIFWKKDDDFIGKTVCYNDQDIQDMLDKFNTPGGLYGDFNGYEIEYLKSSEVAAS